MTAVSRRRHRRWRAVGAFLKTIPGALTAIATLLTAIAGLLAALAQVGVITIRSPIVANPPAEERTVPGPTAGGADGGAAPAPGGPQGPALVYLDQLTPLQQSWYRTGARAVNGRDFARSVAIRQPSPGQTETTVFNLGRHYRQLRFTIGLWDDSDPALQSKCQVFADRQVIYDSGTMTRGTSAEVVRDVSDAFDLTISCTPTQAVGADGEVVLADAQLTAKPGEAPTTTAP
jgi:NPCBM/NEW2 domain-containing protein